MDTVIGGYLEQIRVVRGVVDLAEAQPIRDIGRTTLFRVANDMGGIEQLPVAHGAYRASSVICKQDSASEFWLV